MNELQTENMPASRINTPSTGEHDPGKWIVYFFSFNMIMLAIKSMLGYILLVAALFIANAIAADTKTLMMMDVANFIITSLFIILIMRPVIAKYFLDRHYIKGALIASALFQILGAAPAFMIQADITVKLINFLQIAVPGIATLALAFPDYDKLISEDKKCYIKRHKQILVIGSIVVTFIFRMLNSPKMMSIFIENFIK